MRVTNKLSAAIDGVCVEMESFQGTVPRQEDIQARLRELAGMRRILETLNCLTPFARQRLARAAGRLINGSETINRASLVRNWSDPLGESPRDENPIVKQSA